MIIWSDSLLLIPFKTALLQYRFATKVYCISDLIFEMQHNVEICLIFLEGALHFRATCSRMASQGLWLTDCQMVNIRSSSHFLTLANDSLGVVPSPSLQEPSESDKPGRLMSRNGRKPISCGSRSARRKSRREVV